MTSTDLAHALGVPMDTPGCWDVVRNNATRSHERICLWPMPDSGEPGAELWTYWLMRALGWPKIAQGAGLLYWVSKDGYDSLDYSTPIAALYAAYKETKS